MHDDTKKTDHFAAISYVVLHTGKFVTLYNVNNFVGAYNEMCQAWQLLLIMHACAHVQNSCEDVYLNNY